MENKQVKWPLKAILQAPELWLRDVIINYHLRQGMRNGIRAAKHNRLAGLMLNIIKPGDEALPPDDQLWLVFVEMPPVEGKTTIQEWHMWGPANSPLMSEFLSRIPGKVLWMKSIAQARGDIFITMTKPPMMTAPVMPGDNKWIQ